MRRLIILAVMLLAGLALFGWRDTIRAQSAHWQRDLQEAMAGALTAIRAGQPGAWAGLMALCFGYGFVHAIGPGHGKVLVGGWGLARPIGMARLAGVAALASVGQAVTAVALVVIGVTVLGLTRSGLDDLASGGLQQVSRLMLAGIGLWLVWRGGQRIWRSFVPHHAHDHAKDGSAACPGCGHRHAPAPEEIAAAGSWRAQMALILAIAIRPCSGALILLVLCWQMGIFTAGVVGTFAMALGTAALTVTVAVASVSLRAGALAGALDRPLMRHAAGLIELVLGLAVLAAALTLRGLA